ncbi:hypothetical protein OG259_34545 [Streptomyces sp. NBC_00250]|uniref:hypothetical protein n=1 Tax=Streptomyces sp. NBC_00250 TaxID=2903641 RepID=UPI002E2ACD07|nr:hypothetical protein [Streptomyces sp. NBC_00250]
MASPPAAAGDLVPQIARLAEAYVRREPALGPLAAEVSATARAHLTPGPARS